ncbi:MAG: helix-turn-helix domain-containing protein [Betaproteobacteria bacterium]|nr:helix-turn-helix domain-containing protein [Betaproteobacteria bacterium]
MRFDEAYEGWACGRLTQEEAARLLEVCERSFRRYIGRYKEAGMEGLIDKRVSQLSHRPASVDAVLKLVDLYRSRYTGWNVEHFHAWHCRKHEGPRSYSWVKSALQAYGVVERAPKRGAHRKRRERAPLPGMLLHQLDWRADWVRLAA